MGDKSLIEWTDATWNIATGCTKVSAGCKNCYAERIFPRVYPAPRKFTDVVIHWDRLDLPLRWRAPRMIFVNSLSDLFHESFSATLWDRVWAVMALCPQHTFQILTKRPATMRKYMTELWAVTGRPKWERTVFLAVDDLIRQWKMPDGTLTKTVMRPWPLPNVWLGVSAEDQSTWDERVTDLVQTPAAVIFVSYEPALGPVHGSVALNIMPVTKTPVDAGTGDACGPETYRWECRYRMDDPQRKPLASRIQWVIAGGESGPKARPANPAWFRSMRDQCEAAGVPYFFKQWGEWEPTDHWQLAANQSDAAKQTVLRLDGTRHANENAGVIKVSEGEYAMRRVGKKAAGRVLDGRFHDDMPARAR